MKKNAAKKKSTSKNGRVLLSKRYSRKIDGGNLTVAIEVVAASGKSQRIR